ncbi:MAG: tetraacyldisaccharide 4'-kinase, partial [Planctomycetes bacterium]|nr:tetraacyldisaccharide 4'-kinase [Planctomycetota bacterium]
ISGKKRGFVPKLLRSGLKGLSLIYAAAIRSRNLAFDLGIRRVHTAPVPVISVGNLTAGGTGKTPFTAWLANWFHDKEIRVAILSRGYRSVSGAVNDEKMVLDQLCPHVPHLQNPDRIAAASSACREHAAQLLILDDGFQHRRLFRDLDIVLIDVLNPWGYGALLPRGLLREPLQSLRRADLVVITRADQCPDRQKQEIIEQIQDVCPEIVCVEVGFPPESLVNAEGLTAELSSLSGKRIAAFCGIGNPDSFHKSLLDTGYDVSSFRSFSDHHHYSLQELDEIGEWGKQAGALAIVITQKDLVKIKRTELNGLPLWAVRIGTRILKGGETLENDLQSILNTNLR